MKPKQLAKITAIKADLARTKGREQTAIAKKYNLSRSFISDIATGRTYKEVPWPDDYLPVPNRAGGQHKILAEHDHTSPRILELESEVIHLTEERNRERARYKASAKAQGLFRALKGEIIERVHPIDALPSAIKVPKKDSIEEHLVMHLSDGHHDQVVTLEDSGNLEEYDFNISCARAERYVETTLEWATETLYPKFHFSDLWILAYGDHTSGEIHSHAERSYYRNQMKNTLAIGRLHSLMYRDLASHFERVHVVYLSGNHGRRTTTKDYHGAQDNWDFLIGEIAARECSNIPNIDFLIPNAYSINLEINKVGFNICHGDDVRGNGGIPFYGMARRQKALIALNALQAGPPIRYFCMGHHHNYASMSDVNCELIVNGAWLGNDSYSYNSFGGYREPCQLIHGVNAKHGITWRLPVKLKYSGEKKGPKRYIIDGGRDVGPLRR